VQTGTAHMNTPLLFYSSDYCPFAHRAWIALEHTGTPYTCSETNVWGLRLPVTRAFRERSRSRTLPTLWHEGMAHGLDDSLPILNYLDRLSGGKLTPSDPEEAYHVYRVIANDITAFIGCFYGYLGGKVSLAPSEVGRLAKLQASTAALEAAVGRGLATPEQEITMADIALFPFLERAVGVELLDTYRGLSVAEFWLACPKLLQWYDRMLAVPAVAATLGTHRTAASLATQPYAGKPGQTRRDYLTHFYAKYAADTVAAENATLVTVRPPSFDAAEWERLRVELGEAGTADEYIAVPPGGSAEVLVPAKRQRMDTVQRQP